MRLIMVKPFQQTIKQAYADPSVSMTGRDAHRADLTFSAFIFGDAKPHKIAIAFYREDKARTLS